MSAPGPIDAVALRRKIAWRVLPFIFVLYIVSYLDRANAGFAKLAMADDLKFSEAGLWPGIWHLLHRLSFPGNSRRLDRRAMECGASGSRAF